MAPYYQKMAADYQKIHPNVKFDIQAFTARDFEAKIAAAIPSDTSADIMQGTIYAFRKYVEAGLLPKNPPAISKLASDPVIYPKDLTETLIFNNEYFGLPFYQGRHGIFYNTDYLAAAGLTTPPATMDDLTTYAQKLVKVEGGEIKVSGLSLRLSGAGSGIAEKFGMYLYPNGGDILLKNAEGKYRSNYNNEAGMKTLKMYIDMLYKLKTDDPKIKNGTEGFQLGATAMFARESNVIADTIKKAPNIKFNAAPMPKGVRWGDLATPVSLHVSKNSKNADTAWDFILFCSQEQNLNYLLAEIGWIPQRQDFKYEETLKKSPQFAAFTFKDPNYKLFTAPNIAQFDEIQTKLAERLAKAYLDSSLLNNDAGMKKVLDDAAKESDDILKKANLYG